MQGKTIVAERGPEARTRGVGAGSCGGARILTEREGRGRVSRGVRWPTLVLRGPPPLVAVLRGPLLWLLPLAVGESLAENWEPCFESLGSTPGPQVQGIFREVFRRAKTSAVQEGKPRRLPLSAQRCVLQLLWGVGPTQLWGHRADVSSEKWDFAGWVVTVCGTNALGLVSCGSSLWSSYGTRILQRR